MSSDSAGANETGRKGDKGSMDFIGHCVLAQRGWTEMARRQNRGRQRRISVQYVASGGVALKYPGAIEGPWWLDEGTGNGSVGLAKSIDAPFTGAR